MTEERGKDFFISYHKADSSWAEWIAWQLEHAGYTTILQAWDFRPGSNVILEIDQATITAKRTIAVLSTDYLTALDTRPEWAEALRQDRSGQDGKLLPIRVRDCTPKGLLATLISIDLVGLNALTAQNTLLADIQRTRAIPTTTPPFPDEASPQATPAFPGNWPLVSNVPYRRNTFFTGREQLLKTLHDELTGTSAVALTQALAIHGLGGIGKTQTAIEYAYRYQQQYQMIFWVRAAAVDTLCSDFVSIADLLNLPEKDNQDQIYILNVVKRWLSRHKNWLLILDNADNLEIIPEYLPTGENGHVLLTTRDPSVQSLVQGIEVEQLNVQEGCDLLLHRAYGLAAHIPMQKVSQDELNIATQIVKEMGGHPLAIDQAGAYIEQTRCGLARYPEIYRQHRADLFKWQRRVPSNYPRTVATTWTMAFEQVEQRDPLAAELLRVCAFLDPDAIPEDLIVEGAGKLEPALQARIADAFTFNEMIDILRSFALIRRLGETNSLALHRLVQMALKDRLDETVQRQWAERVVRLVSAVFPEVEFKTWDRCKRYLPQVFACFDLIKLYEIETTEAALLLHQAGWYLNEQGRYSETEPLYLRALAISEKTRGLEHIDTSATLNDLAGLYRNQGRYSKAEPLYMRSIDIYEKHLGPHHPYTATSLSNLANLYNNQGNYQQAELLYLRALAIREQSLSPHHPDTATSLNNLANLYKNQGNYQQAEPLYIRSFDIYEKHLGPHHPYTATSLNNLAGFYYNQGNYQQAEPLYLRALAIREQSLGPHHPDTAQSLNNLASFYYNQGKYEEAESLVQRALAIREQSLGPDHPDTARSFWWMATLAQQKQHYQEAKTLYQRAYSILVQALGKTHPSTQNIRHNFVALLHEMGDDEQAQALE